MIDIKNKTQCCGCRACVNICPKGCISMKADEEGFLYPQVDVSKCVKCGQCEKVCPVIRKPNAFSILKSYAISHPDLNIKQKSASGGLFTILCEEIFKNGGVVFGASFDADWNVVHSFAENLEDLDKLRRSKYVQSDIGKTYQQAKHFLEQGRLVLFTATPCQIAGLRNFLGKDYDNLFTAEIFCYGVPSPAVWQKFLRENTKKEQIDSINFRHKYFGWDASFLKITYKNGDSLPKVPHLLLPLLKRNKGSLFKKWYKLPFWISSLYTRPSCYYCHFKGEKRFADFSMGDFWGIQKTYPKLYDSKGVSVALINTEKALSFFSKIDINKTDVDFGSVIQFNKYLMKSMPIHSKRADFFRRYKTEDFAKLKKELTKNPLWKRVLRKIFRYLKLDKKTK